MGGLEVLDSTTDSWLRVPARDDAILVNSGTVPLVVLLCFSTPFTCFGD